MSLPSELTYSEERGLLLELLNLASADGTEQQRQDGVAILKRMPAELVWDVMLELHRGEQQHVLGNGTLDQRPLAEQNTYVTDALDAVATAEVYAGSPGSTKGSTAVEQPDAASCRAATDSSTFSLAQLDNPSDQALTPRLGDVQDLEQSPDRAAEQQRHAVSHRVLAALQQRELAAGSTKALGSLELFTGSVDMHRSTADFCLVPGSHGEAQAACTTPAGQPAESSAAITGSSGRDWSSAVSAAAAEQQHQQHQQHATTLHRQHGSQYSFEPATAHVAKPAGAPPPRAATASANELRQSAVDGLKSFQLVIRTDNDWEDTASESAYSGVVTPTAGPAYSMQTPTAGLSAAARFCSALHSPASSCHTPASMASTRTATGLPSFSSTGSSSRTPGSAQQALTQKQQKQSGIGLGMAINALRRSITGRKQLKGQEQPAPTAARRVGTAPAATANTKQGIAPGSTSRAGAGSTAESPPSSLVQGRLSSFTETERVRAATAAGSGSSSSRVPARAGTPGSSSGRGSATATSSSYRPPSTTSSKATRAQTGSITPAAALHKSPLGKVPGAAAPAARSVAGSPAPSTSAAAAAVAKTLVSRIPSTGGSAPHTPAAAHSPFSAAAAAEQRTPVASPGTRAGMAWLAQQGETCSAPVSPCPSRPESVASHYSVASTSKLGVTRMAAASGQLPSFAMTKQMVEGKQPAPAKQQQLHRTPGSSARPSAAAAAAGSRAGYMRQGSDAADAVVAAAAAAAIRGGGSRLPGAAATPASTAKGSSRMAAASPFAAAGGSAASRHGFAAGAARMQAGSRCDSHIGLQRAAAAGPAGRRAGGASELRRSRSHGSLAELMQEEKRDVSEVRRMWQQKAAEHVQHEMQEAKGKERLALQPQLQQHEPSSSSAIAAAAAHSGGLSRPTSGSGVSRIPSLGSRLPSAPGIAPAAAAHAQPRILHGPEVCESPPTSPVGLARDSSRGSRGTGITGGSDASFPAAAAAAGAVPAVSASFVPSKMMGGLISRLDEMLLQGTPAQTQTTPLPAAAAAFGTDGINRQLFSE